jgi:hypothetical protein
MKAENNNSPNEAKEFKYYIVKPRFLGGFRVFHKSVWKKHLKTVKAAGNQPMYKVVEGFNGERRKAKELIQTEDFRKRNLGK